MRLRSLTLLKTRGTLPTLPRDVLSASPRESRADSGQQRHRPGRRPHGFAPNSTTLHDMRADGGEAHHRPGCRSPVSSQDSGKCAESLAETLCSRAPSPSECGEVRTHGLAASGSWRQCSCPLCSGKCSSSSAPLLYLLARAVVPSKLRCAVCAWPSCAATSTTSSSIRTAC